jgi:hypothetical protein
LRKLSNLYMGFHAWSWIGDVVACTFDVYVYIDYLV